MELTPYVDSIRRDLTVAAEVAGEEARVAAERLTSALDAAVRLALLDALSTAAGEITRELAPRAVEVRLRGRDPEFVVTPPAVPDGPLPPTPPPPPPPPLPDGDEGIARVTLRLPESLKSRVEEAAARAGVSVNTWLVRAVTTALDDTDGPGPGAEAGGRWARGARRGPRIGQHLTGWVR